MKKLCFAMFCIVISFIVTAQSGVIDTTFNSIDFGYGYLRGTNNSVEAICYQPDGKILIGGEFTAFNDTAVNRIARLNADGTLDTTFNQGSGADLPIKAIAFQSDGKIIIGGTFTSYNGTARNRIARLNADGTLDSTFNPGTGSNSNIYAISIQPDGKIIIGGSFTTYNSTSRSRIARLNSDGTLDGTFNPGTGANGTIYSVAIQPDGKIIIGGSFPTYNGTSRNRIARINSDGTLDGTFNPGTGASSTLYSVAIQPDGKIIIGGDFTSYNGTTCKFVTRLNTDGSIDPLFNSGTGFDNTIYDITLLPGGKIFIGGYFNSYNGTLLNKLACLNSDGTLDTSFNHGVGANFSVYVSIVQPDGKIIIGGGFSTYNSMPRNGIARLHQDGTLEASFIQGTGTNHSIYTISCQSDEKIIIGGMFTSYNDTLRNKIARVESNGNLDNYFFSEVGANNWIYCSAVQPDGKIIIGGDFTAYNGISRNRIARLNHDGSIDTTFNPGTGANLKVNDIVLQPDGKIIIVGIFFTYNGTSVGKICRLNNDGTIDSTFNQGTGADYTIQSVVLQPDGKIIIVGNFTYWNNTWRRYIARLNPDGSLDTTFDPGITSANGGVIYTAAYQPDGKVIIGGGFTSFNGISRKRIARLNADGTLDNSFDPGTGADNSIKAILLQPDGRIIIGGSFTTYNDTLSNCITRLNVNGSIDTSFVTGIGANGEINALSFQPDGKIIIGGNFTSYNGVGRNRIARLLVDDCINSYTYDTIISCSPYTWIDGNTYTSSNNTATYALTNSLGCDSIVVLNLTIHTVDVSISVSGYIITSNALGADYQWIDCDNNYLPFPGETSQTYTATSNGNYAVIVTQYGCTDTSACVSINNIGIDEVFEYGIHIYPNPFSDELIIEAIGSKETLTFEISNTLGQIVLTGEFSHSTIVHTGNFVTGLYVVKIGNDNFLEFRKVLKE